MASSGRSASTRGVFLVRLPLKAPEGAGKAGDPDEGLACGSVSRKQSGIVDHGFRFGSGSALSVWRGGGGTRRTYHLLLSVDRDGQHRIETGTLVRVADWIRQDSSLAATKVRTVVSVAEDPEVRLMAVD